MQDKISKTFLSIKGDFKTIHSKKISKSKPQNVKVDPYYCITELKILTGYLYELNINIDETETTTQIFPNLPEAYKYII